MYIYIKQQGKVLKNIIENRKKFFELVVNQFKEVKVDSIIVVGSGSSYNAIMASKHFLQKILGIEVKIHFPYSFNCYEQVFSNNSLIIGISQTGSSTETVNALIKARGKGAHTLAITAYKDAYLAEVADKTLILACGDENSEFKTKGYTSTILTLLLIALEVGLSEQKISKDKYDEYIQELLRITDTYDKLIDKAIDWYTLNKNEFLEMDNTTVIGVGPNYGTALEASIKLIETNYFMSSSYELEEYLHGPNMALGDRSYIFYLLGEGKYHKKMEKLYKYTKNLTDYVYVIRNGENIGDRRSFSFNFTEYEDFSPLQYIVPFQILCYNRAEDLNFDLSKVRYPDFQCHMAIRK
ncbi:SIS domain-containing protein [Anaerobranca gottschalkii]|nr:SIS domain-containing protein [Anaerobranca gottschalkii]